MRKSIFAVLIVLLGAVSIVVAQSTATCPDIVKDALQATSGACAGIGRNQACYGNFTLQTQFQADVTPPKFDAIGELAEVTGRKSLQLSSFDVSAKSWGVALMKIQANLPDALPGQNVTFVMFGNVEIDNAYPTLALTTKSSANVRSDPTSRSKVVTTLKGGTAVVADGRIVDSSWLRIQLPDGGGEGWVQATLLRGAGDLTTLAVVDPSAPALTFGPMQAFYFKSGLGNTPCSAVPPDGILLQSPANQRVTLMVNGAELTLGSTVFVQAQPNGFMTVSVIEGNVTVTVNGFAVPVPAGSSVSVPLDANGLVAGLPNGTQPYDPTMLAALPTTLLPIPVSIPGLVVTPEATVAATAAVIPVTAEITAEATAAATPMPLAVTPEATGFAAVDAVPLSGTWSESASLQTGCGLSNGFATTTQLTVENNGTMLAFGGGDPTYKRSAPGIYSYIDLPYITPNSVSDVIALYVQSSTEMYLVYATKLRANNCSVVITTYLTYIGP
ncbi:MAG TPA: SH3 domain-containing protein [Phototrophicaceae bacterium]|nr:SH3 domain-containing protein [Phototrophicaceae bacterium]